MTKLRSGYWEDLTTTDLEELDPEMVIALLPVSATEQHGPHLPLSTDSAINRGIVKRTLELIPDDLTLLVLPALTIGDSAEHGEFPGTLSLSPELLIQVWTEIGASVARSGLRKLVIFNSHGGQTQIVDIVAQRLRMNFDMLVTRATYFRFGKPEGLFEEDEVKHGLHGGADETSMMLQLHPDLVRQEQIRNFPSVAFEMAEAFEILRPEGPGGFAWASQDLHPSGACGDATQANADKGRLLLEHAASRLAVLLQDLRRAPLSLLRDRS